MDSDLDELDTTTGGLHELKIEYSSVQSNDRQTVGDESPAKCREARRDEKTDSTISDLSMDSPRVQRSTPISIHQASTDCADEGMVEDNSTRHSLTNDPNPSTLLSSPKSTGSRPPGGVAMFGPMPSTSPIGLCKRSPETGDLAMDQEDSARHSSSQEQSPSKPSKVLSARPAGGVALFGKNANLMQEMRARLRKPETESVEEAGDTKSAPAASGPITSPTPSTSSQLEPQEKTLNPTLSRARRPNTRMPSFYRKTVALVQQEASESPHDVETFFQALSELQPDA